jgi:uncharacterized protein
MTPVDLIGLHAEATSGTPVVLLRERDDPHRVLPIAIGGPEAVAIALGMSGESPPRPLTHDLFAALIDTLDARIDHVEVTGVDHGTFHAEVAMRGPFGEVVLDSRPSDAIALALRAGAPLFASDAVLAEAGAEVTVEVEEVVDDEEIDEDVDRFRSFLEGVDPTEFGTPPGPEDPPDDDAG